MRTLLRALVGVLVFAALIDIFSSYARAATVDAGVASGTSSSPMVATSPLTVTAPATVAPAPPDALEHPREAVDTALDTYKHSGLWAAVLMVAYILLNAAAKKTGPKSFLGSGRVAMGIAGAATVAGALVDATMGHVPNGWMSLSTTVLIAAAALLSPHTVHTDSLEAASLGGGKGG